MERKTKDLDLIVVIGCILWACLGFIVARCVIKENVKVIYMDRYKYRYVLDDEMITVAKYIRLVNRKVPESVANRIAYEVVSQSRKESLPFELVLAIIEVESTFNPMATSSKNARGLMQVLYGNNDINKIYNIDYNISRGIEILKMCLSESKGDLSAALYKYVGGSDKYKEKVLRSIGSFILFRSIEYAKGRGHTNR